MTRIVTTSAENKCTVYVSLGGGEGDKDKALNVFLVVDNKKITQNNDFFSQAFNFLIHGI